MHSHFLPPLAAPRIPASSFGSVLPPATAPDDESLVRLVPGLDAAGNPIQRDLVRRMMAPNASLVLTNFGSLDPSVNGVRSKPRASRGVMQGDTVYRNFKAEQDLVMANTAVDSKFNTVTGVAMVTKTEEVEGNPINFAVAFAGSLSMIFRGFTFTNESYTAEPGHRFGLDFGAAAIETGLTDGISRIVNIHRRARGFGGFRSSYFTALSPGVAGYKIHALVDY